MNEFGIVANVCEAEKPLRKGAKVWLTGGENGDGFERRIVYGLSFGGRLIEKWCAMNHLTNFRASWMPQSIRNKHPEICGTRAEMEERAAHMNEWIARADHD